ncbi:YwpF family protein [Neobacillus sp. PS3-34]|uniref:YwpF family protein n=1 Tax=Neobacillus sp. PS3-34 TaxID=3070678 RepID=UPI0027E1E756|nr:YwpF family protein [Neobacillus sp. PS3-34]WML46596.1 YwpF family protein [Neobacillus sp. PS3-34]
MKTFKLVSLEIVDNDDLINIPLKDGLIINKEDEKSTWLLEAYSDHSLYDYVKNLDEQKKDIIVQAVITKLDNDPAYFQTRITSLKKFSAHMSILFEGHLRRMRNDYSELLLGSLLQQGLSGEALLTEFKEKMKSKPRLK